jgi:hypothetical protein
MAEVDSEEVFQLRILYLNIRLDDRTTKSYRQRTFQALARYPSLEWGQRYQRPIVTAWGQ